MRFDKDSPEADEVQGRVRRHPVRALFLSDVHLGTRASKSEKLYDFLRHHDARTIYLVGDIVDGWRLRARWHWPQAHNDVIRELFEAAARGTKIVYLPGNHDAFLRDYPGIHFAGVEVAETATHVAADGRRYVVVHGDHFDRAAQVPHGIAAIGGRLNAALFALSDHWNRLRIRFGLSGWSLSQWARRRVKESIDYLGQFEREIAALAAAHHADGVICGHVHHPAMHDRLGVRYINCGDWLESCTAAVERLDGTFEIRSWPVAAGATQTRPPLGGLQEA
ncbi:UDP-2,3-diacylglucosamine diphosphatase [Pseudorhodoplanes sp.]|uniref:UDP-2,3-diacylglucosamine diphosphatase n=1 Tax=Pseudorhodoplanes sp. TaxID=1934341 RepID=UPI003D125FB3